LNLTHDQVAYYFLSTLSLLFGFLYICHFQHILEFNT